MSSRQEGHESGDAALVNLSEGEVNKLKPLTSGSSTARKRDRVFDVLFFVETGTPYETDAWRSIPRNMLGRIRKATADAKEVGYTGDELAAAVQAWPRLMGDRVNITAMALVTNMPRLKHLAAGGQFNAHESAEQKIRRAIANGALDGIGRDET